MQKIESDEGSRRSTAFLWRRIPSLSRFKTRFTRRVKITAGNIYAFILTVWTIFKMLRLALLVLMILTIIMIIITAVRQ
jgi:hypothetical protein